MAISFCATYGGLRNLISETVGNSRYTHVGNRKSSRIYKNKLPKVIFYKCRMRTSGYKNYWAVLSWGDAHYRHRIHRISTRNYTMTFCRSLFERQKNIIYQHDATPSHNRRDVAIRYRMRHRDLQPILTTVQDLFRIYFAIYFKSVLEHNDHLHSLHKKAVLFRAFCMTLASISGVIGANSARKFPFSSSVVFGLLTWTLLFKNWKKGQVQLNPENEEATPNHHFLIQRVLGICTVRTVVRPFSCIRGHAKCANI